MLLAVAKGLGINDDLVFAIDGCYAVIPLNRAFTRCHFSGFVIGNIALDFLLGFALADFRLLCCQKFINAIRSFIQRFRFCRSLLARSLPSLLRVSVCLCS